MEFSKFFALMPSLPPLKNCQTCQLLSLDIRDIAGGYCGGDMLDLSWHAQFTMATWRVTAATKPLTAWSRSWMWRTPPLASSPSKVKVLKFTTPPQFFASLGWLLIALPLLWAWNTYREVYLRLFVYCQSTSRCFIASRMIAKYQSTQNFMA